MKLTDREFGGRDVEMPFLLTATDGEGGDGGQAGAAGTGEGGGDDKGGGGDGSLPGGTPGAGASDQQASGWAAGLSDADLSANPSLNSSFGHSKDLPEYARNVSRSYLELQKKIGAKGIVAPGKDATQQELRSFFTEQGCPETPEGYKDPEGLVFPEGMPRDLAFEADLKGLLHQVGVPSWKFEKLMPGFIKIQENQMIRMTGEMNQYNETAIGELRAQWGSAYDAKLQGSEQAMYRVFGESYDLMRNLPMADGNPMGSHPIFLQAFANLNDMMGEPGLAGGDFQQRTTRTPNEAKAELNKIMAEPEFKKAWTTRDHPEHDLAVKRVDDLYASIAGDAGKQASGTGAESGMALTGGASSRS